LKTEVVKIDARFPESEKIAYCAKIVRQGGLVIFPTETVYGLAANFENVKAMARLREVKQRPGDKPFAILVGKKEHVFRYTPAGNVLLSKLIEEFWPGPLTVVVPGNTPGSTIGVRMPKNKIALALLAESGCALAAPSANVSGKPAPSTCPDALIDLNGRVEIAIDGGPAEIGQASSVVDLTQGRPIVVREGVISQAEVDRVAKRKTILFVCTGNSCRSVMAEYLFRQMLKDRGDVEVVSAGMSVYVQGGASRETIKVLAERGIDAANHRAQSVSDTLLRKADMVLVMTKTHRQQVVERVPEIEPRVFLLREFADGANNTGADLDIPDPIGQSTETYEKSLFIIESALKKIIKLI